MKRRRGLWDVTSSTLASSRRLLLPLVALLAAPNSTSRVLVWAQCGSTSSTPIEVTAAAGAQALQAAVNCSGGGQVEAVWAGSVTLDATIGIGAGTFLSLSGQDDTAAVVGAATGSRLFSVSAGGGLQITGLTLRGGTGTEGGAIRSSGAVTLEGCVLDGNEATSGDGGGVWADGGSVDIMGGEFLDNVASKRGGAVRVVNTTLSVSDGAVFENNKAEEGGAIFGLGAPENTTAEGSGRAITLTNSTFRSNNASTETPLEIPSYAPPWDWLEGGGALALSQALVEIKGCMFDSNHAQLSGGAIHAGESREAVVLDGCTFRNNTTPGFGGAMCAASALVTGGTQMELNQAGVDGGAIFGWSDDGMIELEEMDCTENVAGGKGGCIYVSGEAQVRDGTYMEANDGKKGGCIYTASTSVVGVEGGEFFRCHCTENGAFLFASAAAQVDISGGIAWGGVADRRAGAVYCSGEDEDEGLDGAAVTISGGVYKDNEAKELGGAVVAWGKTTLVTITGGEFFNNTARYFGGFVFLEEEASLFCEGAMIEGNNAGEQGGGIYARDATSLNVSCDVVGNNSPQGPGVFLTHVTTQAIFRDMTLDSNVARGGSTMYVVKSPVEARNVTFRPESSSATSDHLNRAVQVEDTSTFEAVGCVFEGWMGDTVIQNSALQGSSLVLDECDFSESAADNVVLSPSSDAKIRNARLSERTILKAAEPHALVDRAVTCSNPDVCGGSGACVDSILGVLCECLSEDDCVNNPPTVSLNVKAAPPNKTYFPQPVLFTLLVSAGENGITDAIWELLYDSPELDLDVIPSSGILSPGGSMVVNVSGEALTDDVGGILSNSFTLSVVGGDSSDGPAVVSELEVPSTFFLCRGFEFAVPMEANETTTASSASADSNGIHCESCGELEGDIDGVDCDAPGATLASLPIKEGYWRQNNLSIEIFSCVHSDACAGASSIVTSDDYCAEGYEGPYCAVCKNGYGRGVDNTCHACDGTKASLLIALGAIFSLVLLVLLAIAIIFLVGGLDAVGSVKDSLASSFHVGKSSTGKWTKHSAASVGSSSTRVVMVDLPLSHNRKVSPTDVSISGPRAFAPAFNANSDDEIDDDETTVGAGQDTREDGHQTSDSGASRSMRSDSGSVTQFGLLSRPDGTKEGIPGSGRGIGVGAAVEDDRERRVEGHGAKVTTSSEEGQSQKSGCCDLGTKINRWMSKLPLDKLKILVVVWQILAVFPTITAVEFPPVYARFLNWIDFVNLDLGHIFSASCLLPTLTHYGRLLVATLGPLILLLVLVVTYHLAKSRAGIGSAGIVARRAAWSRHMAAGLLITFLVFTSASTLIFRTFACDDSAVEGESFLRADYSISCNTVKYTIFKVYAALMVLVYPVGIPLLYFSILWTNRESLNPTLEAQKRAETEAAAELEAAAAAGDVSTHSTTSRSKSILSHFGTRLPKSMEEAEKLEERIRQRRQNPDLVPSMFLWKDFGADMYYYEVIECGRRILLTGVLIFIAPYSSAQAALACIFAFASLLGFELLRPHLDPTDAWLYRLGCVVIFLSNFLALLIKVDAAGEGRQDALGGLLVLVNLGLVVAVIVTSWFATQQSVDDAQDDENSFTVVKEMITAERLAANDLNRMKHDNRRAGGATVQSDNAARGGAAAPPKPPADAGRASGRVGGGSDDIRTSDRVGGGSGGTRLSGRVGGGSGGIRGSGGIGRSGSGASIGQSVDVSSIDVPSRRWMGGSVFNSAGSAASGGLGGNVGAGLIGRLRQNDAEAVWKQDKQDTREAKP